LKKRNLRKTSNLPIAERSSEKLAFTGVSNMLKGFTEGIVEMRGGRRNFRENRRRMNKELRLDPLSNKRRE